MSDFFPDKIKKLPPYQGSFGAYVLKANNANVLFSSYDAGDFIAPHSHDTENHGIVLKGALNLTIKGNTQKIGVGQWYHIGVNVEHAASFDFDTDVIEFWFKDEKSV
jgi:quercetin dioxygenase-like cupin family protein